MNLVLGTFELTTIGGVGTYLVTVAEELERMGHSVTVFTEEAGEMAAIAEERELRVVDDQADLLDSCDVVYAQDAPSAYVLADRYRKTPQAFCLHAIEHDRWVVPQLPGVTGATVALHDRAARFARSLSNVADVTRLRQPVDTRRFAPRGPLGEIPRRALMLGNYLSGDRLDLIRAACSAAGVELVQRGLQTDGFARSPEAEINDSEIVIGKSRVIVEAMACGRAAYVYDHNGADGWVTPRRYVELEADNFDGLAGERSLDEDDLVGDLLSYRPAMGPANRDIAVAHHGARAHCESLVDLFGRIAPRREQRGAPLDELGRLTRVQWRADARALGFEHEAQLLRAELALRNREGTELQEETVRSRRRAEEAEERAAAAELDAERARAARAELEAEATALRATHRALGGLARAPDRRPPNMEGEPMSLELAVVVPLEDPRADIVDNIGTWTRRQTLGRDRYQLVAGADGRHPDFERSLAETLEPQDEIRSVPGAPLMALYDAAARAARAPVLVFTEAHVRAEPDCLAAVADLFAADHDLDAATFHHSQGTTGDVSRLSERWFRRVHDIWDGQDWPRLNIGGVAIRAETYLRAGGLIPELELFAPAVLRARALPGRPGEAPSRGEGDAPARGHDARIAPTLEELRAGRVPRQDDPGPRVPRSLLRTGRPLGAPPRLPARSFPPDGGRPGHGDSREPTRCALARPRARRAPAVADRRRATEMGLGARHCRPQQRRRELAGRPLRAPLAELHRATDHTLSAIRVRQGAEGNGLPEPVSVGGPSARSTSTGC